MGRMLGIDEAVLYAKEEALVIAVRAENCAEYTLANNWADFEHNGKQCLEIVETNINLLLEEVTKEFLSGRWIEERPYDAFMHLIEYDLDHNLDDDDPERVLWETVLGRNDFCVNVKLLNMIFGNMKGDIKNAGSMGEVMTIVVPILVGEQLEAMCSFAYKRNEEIEREAQLQYEIRNLSNVTHLPWQPVPGLPLPTPAPTPITNPEPGVETDAQLCARWTAELDAEQ